MIRRVLATLAAIVVLSTACGGSTVELVGFTRDIEPEVGTVSLPAANRGGDDFSFRADPGELLLVFFGFANCPDVCPTTMSDARLAFGELGERADSLDLAMVTVDPGRDSAEDITAYVETFVADGIALRTDNQAVLLEVADAFGVSYLVTENAEGEIEVGHTPNLFLVDDTGHLILTWEFGVHPDDLVSDLRALLDERA